LNQINDALENGHTEQALQETNSQTITDQAEQIRQLTEENQTLQNTVAERDNTISELRTQLAESNHDTDENHQAPHNGNLAPSDEEDDGLSPMEYAKKHEEMYHS
jgi:predicted RNase H-like nuclease (RuvC/YqgF family)